MRVAVLVPYPLDRVPGQRFRLEQWAAPLAAMGTQLEFIPLLSPETMSLLYRPGHYAQKAVELIVKSAGRFEFAIRRARDFDAVVIFREALLFGIDWVERLLVRRVPTVFDFDDAVWLPNVSEGNRRFQFLKGFSKIDRILGMVTAVSAGCEYLADHARQLNQRVHICPTSIDLSLYGEPRLHVASDVLTIGWTGSVTSAEYLQYIREPIAKAAKRFPLRLVTLGGSIDIPGVQSESIAWTPANEVPTIRTFDVGIKPAPKVDWARGKCPMKDIQYMALGIPPVATRFGTALESITHEETGFLVDSDEEWIDALERLRDPALRAKLGAAARKVVEARYSSTVAAQKFQETLQDAVGGF